VYKAGERKAEASAAQQPEQGYAPPAQAPPPAQPAGLSEETINALAELGRLHEQGVLTDAEFEEQKRRYLAG
jgi:hypothetical protein